MITPETKAEALELAGELESWFISGNAIPVTQATIKVELAQKIIAVLKKVGE